MDIGAFLMVQWLTVCLAMQGTLVWSLVQEDPREISVVSKTSPSEICCYCRLDGPKHALWRCLRGCLMDPHPGSDWRSVLPSASPTWIDPGLCFATLVARWEPESVHIDPSSLLEKNVWMKVSQHIIFAWFRECILISKRREDTVPKAKLCSPAASWVLSSQTPSLPDPDAKKLGGE